MNRNLWFLIFGSLLAIAAACSKDGGKSGPTVARINDYQLSQEEFQRQLAAELEYRPEVKLTPQVRERFLDEVIGKELLIQEAVRRGLDREPVFIGIMERHWEAALIRRLLEKRGDEIQARIMVPEEEIQGRYERMKIENQNLAPLDTVRAEILSQLREEKKRNQLDAWMAAMRLKADIAIDRRLLDADTPR